MRSPCFKLALVPWKKLRPGNTGLVTNISYFMVRWRSKIRSAHSAFFAEGWAREPDRKEARAPRRAHRKCLIQIGGFQYPESAHVDEALAMAAFFAHASATPRSAASSIQNPPMCSLVSMY